MPKKYRPETDDYMLFTSIISMYGMFRPIEDKLRAAGYSKIHQSWLLSRF